MRVLFLVLFFGFSAAASAGFRSGGAASVLERVVAEGAQCLSAPISGAYRCTFPVGTFADYPKRVMVVVPTQLQRINRLIVHFHGHLGAQGVTPTFEAVLAGFRFEETMTRAGVTDAILLVPESAGACETFNRYFSHPAGFVTFYSKMRGWLSAEDVSIPPLLLTAHSGGYVAVGNILSQSLVPGHPIGRITSAALLDATYSGSVKSLSTWVKAGYGELLSLYFVPSTATHWGADKIVQTAFQEESLRAPLLRQNPSGTWVRSQGINSTHFGLAYRCLGPVLSGKPCF